MRPGKPRQPKPTRFFHSPTFKILLALFIFLSAASSAAVLYYYNHYSRIIDRKLSGEVFKKTARIYAAPYKLYVGQKLSPDQVVTRLRRAGFQPKDTLASDDGAYEVARNKVSILPSKGVGLRLEFQAGQLSRIVRAKGGDVSDATLPPELVTQLFDETRQKRRLLEYNEIPKVVEDALLAAEDQRFYGHFGVDPIRIVGAFIANIRETHRLQGGSTITQQLATNFFLTRERTLRRKIADAFIALMLEQRLTKQQILAMYVNEVYLGNRGSFSIHGFGESAAAYFGKDIQELTLPEAALLAGIIPAPNAFSPHKYPEKATLRRNLVLAAMLDAEMINENEYNQARKAEIRLAPMKVDASDAPYLVDYLRNELLKDFSAEALDSESLRVYTTLDPDLQKAAVEAVEKGIKFVDEQIDARNRRRKRSPEGPPAQVALIALDPHTGEIKAMVGGRDYGTSQYDRITQAFRQPGSIFKPFVYAAAFETSFNDPQATPLDETSPVAPEAQEPQQLEPREFVTTLTTVLDEPTVFVYEDDKIYEPNNYREKYQGLVTLRKALQSSLNVPTVKVAERIGYYRVAELAIRAGLNKKIKPYPSIALGAFEVTPFEMAGAYTIFANGGVRTEPHALVEVRSADGAVLKSYTYEPSPVLRPELAYLMTHLMEGVLESGTGVGVRARGFSLPAAGKTGTSRDGWFAGYTKDWLALAWVGFDDNRELYLEGARSALPIWTEFMIKATALYPPRDPDALYFSPPPGIESVTIDRDSLLLATPRCLNTFQEVFISGTVPSSYCPLHPFGISSGSGLSSFGSRAEIR